MKIKNTKRDVRKFGFFRIILRFFYSLVNRLFLFQILQLVILTRNNQNKGLQELPPGMSFRLINKQELESLADDKELRLKRKFIDHLTANGDDIFGIFKQDALISYICFSYKFKKLFSILSAQARPGFIYAHKSLTRAAYRGQRLHGAGLINALEQFNSQGYDGIISFGEATKFHAVNSFKRAGAVFVGKTVVLGLFGRFVVLYFGHCRQYMTITGPGMTAVDLGPFFAAATGRLNAMFRRSLGKLAG